MVVRLELFQRTTEVGTKPDPVTVRVKAGPRAATEEGFNETIAGTGLFIVKLREADVPPPGAGVNTVTAAVPLPAMSAPLIVAVKRVADSKVVGRSSPFQRTVDPDTKPAPLTVRVKLGPPAAVDVGLSELIDVTGLPIVKTRVPEVPPPAVGVWTETSAAPAVVMSDAGMDACNCVPETKVVPRSAPFHRTTELGTKFSPVTVSTKLAPPAVA